MRPPTGPAPPDSLVQVAESVRVRVGGPPVAKSAGAGQASFTSIMPLVPWWALLSSSGAPVALIGGWTLATAVQPPGYDSASATISSLAAYGATDRWLMTVAFAVLGLCHMVTAAGLAAVRPAGRIALVCGGVGALLVAAFPEPDGGISAMHLIATGVGFSALLLWPCLGIYRRTAVPWVLRARPAVAVTGLVVLSSMWFLLALHAHGAAGVAERVVTGLQSVWPLVVVAGLRLSLTRRRAAAGASGVGGLPGVPGLGQVGDVSRVSGAGGGGGGGAGGMNGVGQAGAVGEAADLSLMGQVVGGLGQTGEWHDPEERGEPGEGGVRSRSPRRRQPE